MTMTSSHWRIVLAWINCPLILASFMVASAYCLHQGYSAAIWVPLLAASNFFVLVALEHIIPRNPAYNLFRDKQSINDLVFNTLNGLTRPSIGVVVALIVASLADKGYTGVLQNSWPTDWPLAAQAALGVLCASFMDYWKHRFAHTWDRLWWFHSLHHSATQMHILKGGRIHLIEEILHDTVTALPLLVLGATPEAILLAGMWGVFTGNMVHANVDQRFPGWAHYVFPTVQLHNLHHCIDRRFQDSNYSGTLPIWDVLFRTFSHPDSFPGDTARMEMGIRETYVSNNLLKQYYQPILWQFKKPV